MTRRPGRRIGCRLLVVAAGVVLVACGGTSGDEPHLITMDEFVFLPDTFVASEGDSIELHNEGAVTHDWTLLQRSIANEAELSDDLIVAKVVVPAGARATLDLGTVEPGTYQYVCAIPGHFSQGMRGTLVVAAGG